MHVVERGIDDPQVAPGRPDGSLGLVDGQFGGALDLYRLLVPIGQLPVLVWPAVDQRVLFQLGGMRRCAHLLQIERGGKQAVFDVAKAECVGQRLWQLAVEEHQIPIVVEQMLVVVGLGNVELHFWVVQAKVRQHVDQDGVGEGDGGRQTDHPVDVGLFALDLAGGLLDRGQRGAQALVVAQPFVGEAEFAGGSV